MLWNSAVKSAALRAALAVCGALTLSACAAHYTQVPPRLSLQPYGRVALVGFSTGGSNAELSTVATRRFAEALLANQSGVELLELRSTDTSLKALAKQAPAVFLGELKLSTVKPHGVALAAGRLDVRASVSGELTVRLVSTSTGGTVWRSSSAADGTVGNVAITKSLPAVAMRDPNEAYGEILDQLVHEVTRDLRPTWLRQ